MGDAPQGEKIAKRTRSAVQETAASTRPKRAAKAAGKEPEKPTAKPTAKRAAKFKTAVTTNGSKTKTPAADGASKNGKVGRPSKRKAVESTVKETEASAPARKRARATKDEGNGKKNADGKEAQSKEDNEKKDLVNTDSVKYAEDAKEEAQEDAAPEVQGSKEDVNNDKSYWLMKAEPETRLEKGVDVRFSIDDLREAKEPEPWDGVRNAAARNHMRAMKQGDLAFFYHSNCKVPGIAGTMEIVKEHSVDESAFDKAHPYYDPKSDRKNPKWEVVHVEFRSKFKKLISLAELKGLAKPGGPLENLQMLKQSRLSVSSVTPGQWYFIMGLAEAKENGEGANGSEENRDQT